MNENGWIRTGTCSGASAPGSTDSTRVAQNSGGGKGSDCGRGEVPGPSARLSSPPQRVSLRMRARGAFRAQGTSVGQKMTCTARGQLAGLRPPISSSYGLCTGCTASCGSRYEKTTRLHRVYRHAGKRALLLHRKMPMSAKGIDAVMSPSPLPSGWTEPLSHPKVVGVWAKPPPLVLPITWPSSITP